LGEWTGFINTLKQNISIKIQTCLQNTPISDEKLTRFNRKALIILKKHLIPYQKLFRIEKSFQNDDFVLAIQGKSWLTDKFTFIDESNHLNYDTIYASLLADDIENTIANSFIVARTARYLFDRENLLPVIKKIVAKQSDFKLVLIQPDFDTIELLENSEFKNEFIEIKAPNGLLSDAIFVLKESDLPSIEYRDLSKEEIEKFQLKKIIEDKNIYASVIEVENKDGHDPQVQVTIAFFAAIHWRKEREVVQINIASEYKEQGIKNEITDVKPLKIKK
jgi:hypothetical protein